MNSHKNLLLSGILLHHACPKAQNNYKKCKRTKGLPLSVQEKLIVPSSLYVTDSLRAFYSVFYLLHMTVYDRPAFIFAQSSILPEVIAITKITSYIFKKIILELSL